MPRNARIGHRNDRPLSPHIAAGADPGRYGHAQDRTGNPAGSRLLGVVLFPLGLRVGAHFNPSVTLTFFRLARVSGGNANRWSCRAAPSLHPRPWKRMDVVIRRRVGREASAQRCGHRISTRAADLRWSMPTRIEARHGLPLAPLPGGASAPSRGSPFSPRKSADSNSAGTASRRKGDSVSNTGRSTHPIGVRILTTNFL